MAEPTTRRLLVAACLAAALAPACKSSQSTTSRPPMPSLPMPSSSSLPSPSLPSPSLPSPSLPSPSLPSPSLPSPSLPSPSLPSPSLPSPSLPSPSASLPSPSSSATPGSPSRPPSPSAPRGRSSSGASPASPATPPRSLPRPQRPGEQSRNTASGESASSQNGAPPPTQDRSAETQGDGRDTQTAAGAPGRETAEAGDDGWETSTELPEVPGNATQSARGPLADGDATGEEEAPGSDSAAALGDGEMLPGVAAAGESAAEDESAVEGESAAEGEPGDELRRALEELDGEILDERIAAADRAADPRSGNRGEGQAQGTRAGGAPAARGNGDGVEPSAGAPARRTVAASVPPAPQPRLPLPADTPDARDDDVVARQLREAAMAETNPELREKLWQEYERYKAGL